MSEHNTKRPADGGTPDCCTCGWQAYGARDRTEGWCDLQDHLSTEWSKEHIAARQAEKIRASATGQNWDMP